MAQVCLIRPDAEAALPGQCVCCGAPATETRASVFAWHSPWFFILLPLGIIPAIIVYLVATSRIRLTIPFCSRHINHWDNRASLFWGGVFAMLVLGVAAWTVPLVNGWPDYWGWLASAGLLLLLAALGVWLYRGMVRVVDLTPQSVTLAAVSEAFAAAARQHGIACRMQP